MMLPERDEQIGKQDRQRLAAHWRLMVLAAILTVRGGAKVKGLAPGMRIIPQTALADALHKLEADGLIVHRDDAWYPASGVELVFNL